MPETISFRILPLAMPYNTKNTKFSISFPICENFYKLLYVFGSTCSVAFVYGKIYRRIVFGDGVKFLYKILKKAQKKLCLCRVVNQLLSDTNYGHFQYIFVDGNNWCLNTIDALPYHSIIIF